jgi:MFS transporter, SP family, major inositol transporter
LLIVSGQLLAFVVNAFVGATWGTHVGVWRWMIAIATVPAVALGIGMIRTPESPRWLVSHGRAAEALNVLRGFRSEERAAAELGEIERLAASEVRLGSGLSHLKLPWVRQIFLAGIGIAIVQQTTGVNSIMYYGTRILSESGFGDKGALIANVLNGVVSVLATFLGIYLLGKIGRRPMLIAGLAGTTGALLLIGIFSILFGPSVQLASLVLISMVIFLIFQQGMVSPSTWVLLSEIFPLRIRGFAMGTAVFVLWMVNFAISFSFPSFVATIGTSNTFFMFFGLGLVAISFVVYRVPETMGQSLEAIEQRFQSER